MMKSAWTKSMIKSMQLNVRIEESQLRMLKELALKERTSQQALVSEAIEMLLVQRQIIAPTQLQPAQRRPMFRPDYLEGFTIRRELPPQGEAYAEWLRYMHRTGRDSLADEIVNECWERQAKGWRDAT